MLLNPIVKSHYTIPVNPINFKKTNPIKVLSQSHNWLVVWNIFFYFSHHIGNNTPNWLWLIFFRGVAQPPTSHSIPLNSRNYFTPCDPHHDIYTFCYWQIFWHSIWHIFWRSIWHISWHFIWHTFWHSIWHSIWHLSGRWGPAVHTELGRSQVEVQRCTLSWEGPRLRSSGAHWQVPGWGPAVHTELGRSQVEVQRCTQSWEGPRLRSSSAHWRNWRRRRRRRRRRTTALIKSNNPHLAGGEINAIKFFSQFSIP